MFEIRLPTLKTKNEKENSISSYFTSMLPPSGRTKEVRDTVMADFKTLVSDMGIGEDTIVIRKDKGDTQ